MNNHILIDANEASRLCGLSKTTIYKLVHQGRLRGFKVLNRTLRFDPADIAALVREMPGGWPMRVPSRPTIVTVLGPTCTTRSSPAQRHGTE